MYKIAIKLVLAGLCFIPALDYIPLGNVIAFCLYTLAISFFSDFGANRLLRGVLLIVWLATGFYMQDIYFFVPILAFDLFPEGEVVSLLIALGAVFVNFGKAGLAVSGLILAGGLIKFGLIHYENLYDKYSQMHDTMREKVMGLEKQLSTTNAERDNNIIIATLSERNRIAREIHDNVGHQLSSSILQVGAMLYVEKDDEKRENLQTVIDTLNLAMESIRNSVHGLRDESVDLRMALKKLVDEFEFCKAELLYDLKDIPIKERFTVISIVKEALANVMHHSNATHVMIKLQSHPKINQLIIKDNGSVFDSAFEQKSGMGLDSIKQRVREMDGLCNFSFEKGFRIFISWRGK